MKDKNASWIIFIILTCFISATCFMCYTMPKTAKTHYTKAKELHPKEIERRRVEAILKEVKNGKNYENKNTQKNNN